MTKSNFGESFIKWIDIVDKSIPIHIINNGAATPLPSFKRECTVETPKRWKLIFVLLMRVDPELALTLFRTSWPWWVHTLLNKWSPVVSFVSYQYNQPPAFKKFMYSATMQWLEFTWWNSDYMKNSCRDPCSYHWTYITKEWIVAPWCNREKVAFSGQRGNISWRNIVIIDMFV